MRILRVRLPMLTPAEVLEYVTGLRQGDAPARLEAVATGALVTPVDPVLAVTTIRPGRRPLAGDGVSSH
jgi:hypothetical protein